MKREPAVHSDLPLLGGITFNKEKWEGPPSPVQAAHQMFLFKIFPSSPVPSFSFYFIYFFTFHFFNILYCFI